MDVCYPELYYMDQNRYAFWPNANDNFLAAFTGVRYLISQNSKLDSSKYELIRKFGDNIYLYRNIRESDVARFYTNTISEESLENLCDRESRERLLENSLALEDGEEISDLSQLKEIAEEQKNSSVTLDAPQKDSHLTGTVSAQADGYVLCMIPYETGWKVTVDGEEVTTEKGDLGFVAFPVTKGEHRLTLTFHPPGLKAGTALSVICWLIWLTMLGYGRRKRNAGYKL